MSTDNTQTTALNSEGNNGYTPPDVWQWQENDANDTDDANSVTGGRFGSINRPTSGARFEQQLPRGDKPLQLYSLNTPNGIKVNILLEELAELGIKEAEYDAYKISILEHEQFGSDFVSINPNSKIPALIDQSHRHTDTKDVDIKIFESGAILLYLAEKFGKFVPIDLNSNNEQPSSQSLTQEQKKQQPIQQSMQPQQRAEVMSWLMWQMGSAPYLGGGFGHFYHYAPKPMQYPIDRFAMETKRQLDVLNKHLQSHEYMSGFGYSIADMAIFPWYGNLVLHNQYNSAKFLQVHDYNNVIRWATQIESRPAVQRAMNLELHSIK